MSDVAQANEPEARTATGEIKDQTASQTQQNDQTKTDTTQTETSQTSGADTKTETKEEPKAGVPEKYDFKAPEGLTLDEATVTEASAVFKELGLTNDQAQKLVDFQAKLSKTQAEAPYTAYNAMREGWQNEVKADKEIGPILPKVKETISKALDTLNDAALVASFKEGMNLTGAGDHPAFVKAFYKLAQSVVEGHHVSGKGPSPHGQTQTGAANKPTPAQAMYPNLP